jgi:hypothetical protein
LTSADLPEHGITGDVLSVMDNASLTDLGVASVGHRLNLLRAVWELKTEQGLEISEEDWTPQGTYRFITHKRTAKHIDVPEHVANQTNDQVDKLWTVIVEQRKHLPGDLLHRP